MSGQVPSSPDGEPFPCDRCGAELVFRPGTSSQHCPYCGHEQAIPEPDESVRELDLERHLDRAAAAAETIEQVTVDCSSCGARTALPPHVSAGHCPFCGTQIMATGRATRKVKPNAVLPFAVERERALDSFRGWMRGLWFAPGRLRREARKESRLQGVYVPYWTYDCRAVTEFDGLRGVNYWTTQTYTTRAQGRRVTRTRQVRRTRWRPAHGRVRDRFDDVLVLASRSLPVRQAERLEPWDLGNLVPYRDDYLAGFLAESYQIGLAEGFAKAREMMERTIRATIRAEIGGDHQQILSLRTRHEDVTFKHVLLPIWISAYRFRDRTFRFLVNARTGEVQGERPWSWLKIALVGLAAILAAAGAVWILG